MQFDVASVTPVARPVVPEGGTPTLDLLRQILEVQKQHLGHAQAVAAAHDPMARWRVLAARWRQDFPDLPESCKEILPQLERAYASMIASLIDEIRQHNEDGLDNEFAMQDLLDRYGMKLGQLGNILSLVGPLAEVSSNEAAS